MLDRKSEIAPIKSAWSTSLSQILIGWLGHETKKNYVQESTNFAGVYIRRGKKRTSVSYISYRLRGKQQMDRLGTILEGWTAEVAAVERTRRKDDLQPNSDPPPTPEFRRHCFPTTKFKSQKCKRTIYLRVI
jgi:hypothetical protein